VGAARTVAKVRPAKAKDPSSQATAAAAAPGRGRHAHNQGGLFPFPFPIPISPEIRKRIARAVRGGASITIIRAEVKAVDHIAEKANPIAMARRSIHQPLLSASRRQK
jgi:hypothetical protein